MLAIERKNEILAILQKEQRVLVSELSKRYDVTDETIRRDLEKLEIEGFVKRTYGGAVLNKNKNVDMPLRIREKTNRDEKQIIAGLVAGLVEEGDLIAIDIPARTITLKVSEEELAARRAKWVCPEPKIKTGYLARYAKLVSSADRGAILE